MIEIPIPGYETLQIEHLVFDLNGTIAVDGLIIPSVPELLTNLSNRAYIHVITADTFGKAKVQLRDIPCRLAILKNEKQDEEKLEYVRSLGFHRTVCFGNGRNDRLMLRHAVLGIGVILDEGAAMETLHAADVICPGIIPAIELLSKPLRLTATLRT